MKFLAEKGGYTLKYHKTVQYFLIPSWCIIMLYRIFTKLIEFDIVADWINLPFAIVSLFLLIGIEIGFISRKKYTWYLIKIFLIINILLFVFTIIIYFIGLVSTNEIFVALRKTWTPIYLIISLIKAIFGIIFMILTFFYYYKRKGLLISDMNSNALYCSQCGSKLNNQKNNFCYRCGTKIE